MAYTEFYCDPVNGSNLNAGSTTDAAAVYTAANGGWNSSTGVFTPASGDPSTTVSVGMFASVYLDAATVGVFVGRVTAVDSTTITVSLTVKIGSAPGTGANGRTIKVGGAWKGPNGAEKWPLENIASALKNVAGDIPRYNLRNNAEYDITSGISNSQAGPFVVQGYTTSAGDGGRAIIDAQSNNILPLTIGATATEWVDIEAKGSANNYGIYISGQNVLLRTCVSHDHYKSGILTLGYGGFFEECEVYATSVAGFYIAGDSVLVRCVAHDNTGNTDGFRIVTCNASLNFCISDTNGAVGLRTNVGGLRLLNCDFYNNASDGIKLENDGAGIFTIENCNLFLNGGYGINGSGAGGRVGSVMNCAFGSGTKANSSGTTTGLSGLAEIGTVVYTANELPWADAPAGDFTLNGAACRGTGRGSFMQTAAGYGGTVSKPDIGAAARGGTFPAVANTRYGVTYGAAGIEYTGLLEIPNSGTPTGTQDATSDDCVVSGKKYGSPQRTGTAAGGGGYTYGDEDQAYVLTTATGAGTFSVANLTNAKILKGTTWGVSLGETGTLEGCVDSTGTNQGTTGLLVAGTFYATGWWDGLAYEAAPDFPDVGNVYNDTVDGEAGTLTFADTTYVLDTAPDYGVAGTGGAKTATLTAAGNVLTGTGAFGVGGTSVTPSYSPDFPDVTSVLTTDTVDGSAGTFDATNLSVGNVIQDVAFGVGLTGTGANLSPTHTTFLSLEAGRNSATAGAGQIATDYSITLLGVTTNGSATLESHTANQVLKSAGGNYNDDNLSVGNVRPVAFGISQTGTLANLVATDAAYVSLEDSRNDPDGIAGSDVLTGHSPKIKNTTYTGSATAETHTANQVISTAGGNWDVSNLSVGNVIQDVAFGLSQTGTGANLLATHTKYLGLEAGRNSKTAGTEQILNGYSVTIAGVTTNGTHVCAGGYIYGDNDPSFVLTTAYGAGSYVPISDSDTVDGGVSYGDGEVGTGVNSTTAQAACAAALAAYNASTLTSQGVRDAMKLAPTAGDPAAGSLDKHLDGILEDTGTTLPAQIAALDISAGTGTYACTWTVDDGSTALEGATVSFWLAGVLRGTGTTNASGQVPMSLDAGTYTVAISLSGYTFASTTHTVSATASTWTKTFSMTAIVFSPTPDADQVTAWGYVYGPAVTVEPGATIVLEQRTAGARQIYDNAPRTLTADGSGLVSAVVWADGSEYRYRRGTGGEWSELFAPEDDEDPDLPNSYRLPGWLGAS